MTADLAIFFNTGEFATSCTYAGTSIDAVWNPGMSSRDTPPSQVGQGELTIKTADVSSPAYRDAVIIDGTTWHVKQVLYGDDDTWTLLLYNERPKLK